MLIAKNVILNCLQMLYKLKAILVELINNKDLLNLNSQNI